MDHYQCKKCRTNIKNSRIPSAIGCPNGGFHAWQKLGSVGNHNYSCKKCRTVVATARMPSALNCPEGGFHQWHPLGGETEIIGTGERATSRTSTSTPTVGWGPYVVLLPIALGCLSGLWEKVREHFSKSESTAAVVSPQNVETISDQEQQLLKAKQTLEDNIKIARERNTELERQETDRARLEEQAATKKLKAIIDLYPATPKIVQRSYEAEKKLEKLLDQYESKYASISEKYQEILRRQENELQKSYETEIDAIKSGARFPSPNSDTKPK